MGFSSLVREERPGTGPVPWESIAAEDAASLLWLEIK
jgi:hypothetical protein